MSYNPNFLNSFKGSNYTFQNNFGPDSTFSFPPPPPPPMIPYTFTPALSDQEFVRKFENYTPSTVASQFKPTRHSISELHEQIVQLTKSFNNIKKQAMYLEDNMETLHEDEWRDAFTMIKTNKTVITQILAKLNGAYLDVSRKLIAKRSSKRLRLKKRRLELQRRKKEMLKERQERSRLIDENLQKIKDDIEKVKQAEEAKLQADVVLRDVVRKKNEAKKCISKLEALVKLRRARQNTARGRGEKVSDTEANVFETKVEMLKKMWAHKLSLYDKEENELRASLQQEESDKVNDSEKEVLESLSMWRQILFGGANDPQVNFHGDVQRFVSVRSNWDRFLNEDGSPLPVGWVLPKIEN